MVINTKIIGDIYRATNQLNRDQLNKLFQSCSYLRRSTCEISEARNRNQHPLKQDRSLPLETYLNNESNLNTIDSQ